MNYGMATVDKDQDGYLLTSWLKLYCIAWGLGGSNLPYGPTKIGFLLKTVVL